MLSYLSIGHRYRPPSSLSIRQHFTFATACSTAERILLKFVLNSRCQSSSSVPPTRLNGAIAMPSTRSYSASVKGIKSLLYSIMRCPDLSLFRVFHDVAHLVRLRFARS